ncbi:MAG: ribosomal protein S18-alanine N-acetyltransferase, partial [Actinomycetota bacterium]|nr:ribosomal protein S18-alanine N-acetyltransferase [Actinomycetota bacterium]
MSRSDVPAVATLERDIYPEPWSARVFFDELAQGNRTYFVATNDGEILGYGGVMLIEDDAHITTLAVVPAFRRMRLGTRLLLALVERVVGGGARHLTLEVRATNTDAQQLYERFGFAPVGKRKGYYAGEDAIVMWALDVDAEEYGAKLEEIRSELGREAA